MLYSASRRILFALALVALGVASATAQTFADRYGTKLVLGGNSLGITPLILQAPSSGLNPYTLTLPGTVGASNQALVTTNGTGTLGWLTLSGSNTGDVTLAGSANYLSIAGQTITRNAIDLAYANNLTGILPIARGGTNSGTPLSGSTIMVSNGTQIVQGAAGTTTTVLHGNASGTPSYGAVRLTADVTGTLPIASGGTNSTATLTGARPVVTTATAIVENNATIGSNTIPKWSSGNFANSSLVDDGTTVTTNENVTLTGAKTLQVGTASSATGSVSFANGSSSYLTTLQAGNASVAVTYKLPTSYGTNGQVLTTDGNNPGQLSWTTRSWGGAILAGQTTSNLDNNDTDYYYPNGYTTGNNKTLSFTLSEMIAPCDGTVRNLYVGLTANLSSGTRTFTVRDVTRGTELTPVSIGTGTNTNNSGTATLVIYAGDLIVVKHAAVSAGPGVQAVWSFLIQ